MTVHEAVTIVLQLAESKWIHRAWRRHRLSADQEKAIRKISALVTHSDFDAAFDSWHPTEDDD